MCKCVTTGFEPASTNKTAPCSRCIEAAYVSSDPFEIPQPETSY